MFRVDAPTIHLKNRRTFTLFTSTLAGVVAFALIAYLPYRHFMERMDYYERKVDRLEQDILNRRLWMTKDHP